MNVRRPCVRLLAAAILCVGQGSLAPPAPAAAPDVPDPSPFLEAAGARLVGVATDGSRIFFTRRVKGVVQLFEADADGAKSRQLTTREQSLSLAVPAPDGSAVVVGYDHEGDENVDLELHASAEERPVVESLAKGGGVQRGSVVWAPTGDRIFYRANDGDGTSFRIHACTPAKVPRDEVVFDARGSWRVEDASPDGGRLLLVRERSNREAALFHFHVESRSLVELHPNPLGPPGAVGEARFVGAGTTVAFTQEYPYRERDAFMDAWTIDLASGAAARAPLVGDGSNHGCTVFEGDAEDIAVSRDATRIFVRRNVDAEDRLAIVDVATNEEAGTLKCPPGELAGLFTDARGRVYSTASSPSNPGSILRWDAPDAAPKTIVLADLGPLDPAWLPGTPESVEIPTADGTGIRAWLWRPKGPERKLLPFLVSIHGGPEGEDRPGWHADRAYLLSLGFGVLAPNVRGSTGRGRLFRDADDGAKRIDAVRDAKAAADWLVAKGWADPKRLGVMGGSYGGYMVMALLTEFPETFAAGAEAVGIVNLETFLEKTAPYRRALREAEYGSLAERALLRSLSPIHRLDRIRAPLLVAHGANDPRVPVGEALQIEAELKRLGRPVETLIFPDEGHGFRKPANRRTHVESLARFFLRHLSPR